jgi:hypothetical protein
MDAVVIFEYALVLEVDVEVCVVVGMDEKSRASTEDGEV